MALIEPNGRPYIACPKCKTNVVWPISISDDAKKKFATTTRSSIAEGIKLGATEFGLDLRESKCLAFHITRKPGLCHRCQSSISSELCICAKCHSANLDW
jgi:hypothetical protein